MARRPSTYRWKKDAIYRGILAEYDRQADTPSRRVLADAAAPPAKTAWEIDADASGPDPGLRRAL